MKNSTIISVSIGKEQAEFLDVQNLSPSDLIQAKINEQMQLFEQYNSKNEKLIISLKNLQKEIGIIYQFLDEIGKFDDFKKWRGMYVLEKERESAEF